MMPVKNKLILISAVLMFSLNCYVLSQQQQEDCGLSRFYTEIYSLNLRPEYFFDAGNQTRMIRKCTEANTTIANVNNLLTTCKLHPTMKNSIENLLGDVKKPVVRICTDENFKNEFQKYSTCLTKNNSDPYKQCQDDLKALKIESGSQEDVQKFSNERDSAYCCVMKVNSKSCNGTNVEMVVSEAFGTTNNGKKCNKSGKMKNISSSSISSDGSNLEFFMLILLTNPSAVLFVYMLQ